MSYNDVRSKYEQITSELFGNKHKFAEFLAFSGRFYKLPSAQTMAVFMESPDAKMVADYNIWKDFGRQVKRGEKSISYISDGKVQHCFEISQTTGENVPFQWKMDKYVAEKFKEKFAGEHEGNFSSVAQCVNFAAVEEVNGSIDGISENLHISESDRAAFLKSVRSMVRQIMVSRCEYQGAFKIKTAPLDLSAVDMLQGKAEFEKLCEWVQLTAKSALRKMEVTINNIISERSFENERNEHITENNRGERQNVQARSGNADILGGSDGELQRGGSGASESTDRGVRSGVAEVYGGELSLRDSSSGDESAVRADRAESEYRSGGAVQHSDGELGGSTSAAPDNLHGDRGVGENEDNGVQTASDGGRGSEAARDLNENADTLYHNDTQTAEERSSAASYEVDIEYNGDYVFVADRFTREELSVDYAGEYEGYLKSITEKYPEYAQYINANYDELLKTLHSAHNMAAEEARQVERARLVSVMAGGGYGDDEADARTEKRIEELDNGTAENKSITAYRVGDFFEFFNDDAQITTELLNLTQTTRQGKPMTGVPVHAFERYKNELAAKGVAVTIGDEREIEKILAGASRTEDDQLSLFDFEPQTHSAEKAQTFPTVTDPTAEPTLKIASEVENFRIDDTAQTAFGQKTRYAANVSAIKTLLQIESEKRAATPDEQKILAQYVGWGGIPQVFDSENAAWAKEYVELKELLSPNEYEAVRGSVLNAHYTSPTVINAMYKALENMGFKSGNVLEPSMGIGNFFGCMPDALRDKASLYGVELDGITGRIAQQLYPKANVQIKGFERTDFHDNFFDVAIGNVPFGSYGVVDNRYDKEKFLIHDYFFAKALDKVAPGGIVALVTSKGTLDKVNTKAREYLAKRAELVGAIRLPNNAFKATANTEVTSDIIFFRSARKWRWSCLIGCIPRKTPTVLQSINIFSITRR